VSLELAVFLAVVVVAVARAPGAASWTDGDGVVAATAMLPGAGHGAAAVVLGALASVIPVGEMAFRVALVGAIALALAAAGIVALARALVPNGAGAAVIGAALLATSPAAAATAASGEGAMAAALVVWALVLIIEGRAAHVAAVLVGVLAAVAPVLAVIVGVAFVIQPGTGNREPGTGNGEKGKRETGNGKRETGNGEREGEARTLVLIAVGAFVLVALPVFARGDAPSVWQLLGGGQAAGARLVHVVADGTGTVLVFAGLVGLGLGALTGLRGATVVLGVAIAAAIAVAVASPPSLAIVPLALVAVGIAPLAAAVARIGPEAQRATIATVAAVPIAAVAALAPRRAPAADDAADGVARVAADVSGHISAGPGDFVATERVVRDAIAHERIIAGLRPDLLLDLLDDSSISLAFRARRALGSDRASFGSLDPRRSLVSGRGFELTNDEPADENASPPPAGPAAYPGRGGRAVAGFLAAERARREAARGHLDRAAHAAGLAGTRFDASDLALLSAAQPSADRPAMYGFVPALSNDPLPPAALPELFGDDLAWVTGLPAAPLTASSPPERRLHALWRDMLAGSRKPDDPAILALGIAAGRATARMLADMNRGDDAIAAANAVLARTGDAETLLVLGSIQAIRGGLGDRAPIDDARRQSLDAAENALGRAIVADPLLVDARVLLGLVQARQGRLDDAKRTWQQGLEVAPGHPELLDLLGKK
jgi:hypothetical protein